MWFSAAFGAMPRRVPPTLAPAVKYSPARVPDAASAAVPLLDPLAIPAAAESVFAVTVQPAVPAARTESSVSALTAHVRRPWTDARFVPVAAGRSTFSGTASLVARGTRTRSESPTLNTKVCAASGAADAPRPSRSEEHTSELQS